MNQFSTTMALFVVNLPFFGGYSLTIKDAMLHPITTIGKELSDEHLTFIVKTFIKDEKTKKTEKLTQYGEKNFVHRIEFINVTNNGSLTICGYGTTEEEAKKTADDRLDTIKQVCNLSCRKYYPISVLDLIPYRLIREFSKRIELATKDYTYGNLGSVYYSANKSIIDKTDISK